MSAERGSLVGCVVGGHYKVNRLIGKGAMGEVYAADGKSGEDVALKVLHAKAAQDPDLVARFQREAEIATQHPLAVRRRRARRRQGSQRPSLDRVRAPARRGARRAGPARAVPVVRRRRAHRRRRAARARGGARGGHHPPGHQAREPLHREARSRFLAPVVASRADTTCSRDAGDSGERTRILDFGVSKLRTRGARTTRR